MDNIKNCNNYKTLATYNSNILNSNINYNSITENFGGAFSISAAVRYPWRDRPCDQVGIGVTGPVPILESMKMPNSPC
tara:strand:+ start:325 stop:558 length:234 start_codon:yes stop_codon:yes gene_type:complete